MMLRSNLKPVRLLFTLAGALWLGACTSMDRMRERNPDPDERLNDLLHEYEEARRDGDLCRELWRVDSATIDCERIMREVERLYAEFPNHPRVLMTAAVMAYQSGRLEKAQFMLDQLLDRYGAQPEAAILRSQVALEQGNTTLARELLEREIRMAPDRSDLREALAAAFYIEGHYGKSRAALGLAGRLGAPGWRISYHHGLLCEAELNWEEACRFYSTALDQKADYLPAQSRLIGLSEHAACRDMLAYPAANRAVPATPVQPRQDEVAMRPVPPRAMPNQIAQDPAPQAVRQAEVVIEPAPMPVEATKVVQEEPAPPPVMEKKAAPQPVMEEQLAVETAPASVVETEVAPDPVPQPQAATEVEVALESRPQVVEVKVDVTDAAMQTAEPIEVTIEAVPQPVAETKVVQETVSEPVAEALKAQDVDLPPVVEIEVAQTIPIQPVLAEEAAQDEVPAEAMTPRRVYRPGTR